MNRILRSLVCFGVFAVGVLGQSNGDWFKARVWDGVGRALAEPSVRKRNKRAEIAAEAFTAGNIVVCRVGTGATALDSSATPVFLDEYTADGTYVSTVAMPTAPSGLQYALTNAGAGTAANTECQITRSADGRYIIVTGYQQLPGTASVSTIPGRRVFGRVDAAGTVDTSTNTTSFASSVVRSAVSVDGSGIWSGGSGGGVFYSSFGSSGTAVQVSNSVTNNRVLNIYSGQLYISGRPGSLRIGMVGTGTPTTTSTTITALPGYPISDNSVGFFMADLDATVSGLDTLYVSDEGTGGGANGGGLKKFSLVSGDWTYNGTFPLSSSPSIPASGFVGLTGTVTSGNIVTLFATRAANQLVKFVDSTGYNVAPTAAPTLLATAAANTAFRGVALAPEASITAPTVVTLAATNVAPDNATFNATANPNGSATTGYFRFSTTDPGTCNDSFGTRAPAGGGEDLGSGTVDVGYSQNVTGLTQATTYYYCAIAQNSGGTSFGLVQSFTTTLPSMSINDVALSEGDAGTTTYTFTVSLSAPAGMGGVTFDIATADGTAQDDTPTTEDEDYVGKSLTGQTIPQGSSTYQFTVSVNGDTEVESNESFFVNLTNVTGAVVADGQGTGTINNDDAGPLNFVVTTIADTNDDVCDAHCSLREAIAAANLNSAADTISFDPALVATPVTISLGGTRLDITDDVVITGPGAEFLTINANNLSQIFIIGNGTSAEISGMSLTGGNASGEFTQGGAVYAAGNLTLRAVHIYGNYAPFGGAISGNGATAVLNIIDSTIANNTADDVGAIVAYGSVNLINSTVSGNTAADFVGAMYIWGGMGLTYSIMNSTITNNSARSDGGLWSDAPNMQIGGSIIAGNSADVGSVDIIAVAVNSLGYNLIGEVASTTWFASAGDQAGSVGAPLDPILAPLANNGGPVPTHAFDLSSGISPAIDKGTAFGLTLDQRGYQRTIDHVSIFNSAGGDGTDIGAYELQAPTAAPVTITGRVLTSTGQPIKKAVVTLAAQDGSSVRATTNAKGTFLFEGVEAGDGYILSVQHKRYRFNSTFINAESDVMGLDIYAR